MAKPLALQTLPEQLAATVRYIRGISSIQPRLAIILGSGLREVSGSLASATALDYERLPHFPAATVEGHSGRLLLGALHGEPTAVFEGRFHFYEGRSMREVAYPVYVAHQLGARILIVTNAAGGIDPELHVGELMLIRDHLNLMGQSPLIGENFSQLGTRFVDMLSAYDAGLLERARTAGQRRGLSLRQGVYAALSGPAYETPSEVRMLRVLGADAVGMSTVPEVLAARHCGMKVLGISVIANKAALAPDGASAVSHKDVLQAVAGSATHVRGVIEGVVEQL